MSHDFIKMVNDIDFSYGFIYECADLVKSLYDYDNYDHLAVKLCCEFIMPIINITKKEHIKEYNKHTASKPVQQTTCVFSKILKNSASSKG